MSQPSIAVVGAGIAGSTLARCLTRHGIPVIVYEKAPATPRYNYAITLEPNSYKPLARSLGIEEVQFRKMTAVETPIGGLGRLTTTQLPRTTTTTTTPAPESENFRAHRNRLEAFLRDTLTIKYEHNLNRIEPGPKPILHFDNGSSFSHDHIIAADGVHSTVRKLLLPELEAQHLAVLPYIAINGKRRIPRETFEQHFSAAFDSSHLLQFPRRDVRLHLDVFDQTHEAVSVNYIYSRPPRGSDDPLYRPHRAQASATEIPEAFYAEIASLGPMPAPWRFVFDVEELRAERKLSWLMRTSRVPSERVRALARQNVVLMGDAVHAQPILGGSGANAAMCDGVELAEEIRRSGGWGGMERWIADRYDGWMDGVAQSERAIEELHSQS